MSNLASKLQQEKKQRTIELPKKAKPKFYQLTLGEKIIGITFCGAICFGAYHIVSNQSAIYEINKDMQDTRVIIEQQQKVNDDLAAQVSELSTYERIWTKAKAMGLNLNENNVKVVQEK